MRERALRKKRIKKNHSDLEKNTLLFVLGFVSFLKIVTNVRSGLVYVVFFEKTDFHILELKLKLL